MANLDNAKNSKSVGEIPAGTAPDPEVVSKPERRRFTAAYKLEILAKADACSNPGDLGALLRREGLYWSLLGSWRKQHKEGALAVLSQKRGRKPKVIDPLALENQRLQRDNAKLQQRLQQAELINDIQKKISALLGIPLNTPEIDGGDS